MVVYFFCGSVIAFFDWGAILNHIYILYKQSKYGRAGKESFSSSAGWTGSCHPDEKQKLAVSLLHPAAAWSPLSMQPCMKEVFL
jgi:hypothetical protein